MSLGKPSREEERAEVDRILASRIFARAPTLTKILSYVCDQYFKGRAAYIKEQNIAVEALGRSLDEFDPDRDSIVRSEAVRLRKRLAEYYETEGAGHTIQLVIPAGGYIPAFVPVNSTVESAPGAGTSKAEGWAARARGLRKKVLILSAFLVIVAAFALLRVTREPSPGPANLKPRPAETLPQAAEMQEVRIAAGSPGDYIDIRGKLWLSDRFYTGGRILSLPDRYIHRTFDPVLYRNARAGGFKYDIPLKKGVYELHFHFAEIVYGNVNFEATGEGARRLNVRLNGNPILSEFDIVADAAGPNVADEKVFKDVSPAGDGYLHLEFSRNALVSGIEILPGTPGKIRPVRILASRRQYMDGGGRVWSPDRYFLGGIQFDRSESANDRDSPQLYTGERYGNFTYAIPVAENGSYTVNLRFSEHDFRPGIDSNKGVGSRIFDVYCNGVALMRHFDILKETRSLARGIDKTFPGLTPNAQGKLVLAFVPVKYYASVNAIEVLDEAR